jgi:anthranilate synthase component 1
MLEGKFRIYPVSREVSADIETPVSAFYALREESGRCFLLESVETSEKLGRYSFLGFEPELEFVARQDKVRVTFRGETEEYENGNPVQELSRILSLFSEERSEELPPFSAGLVGYFGYDTVRYFERLPDTKPDRLNLPDIHLMMPKVLVAFDHIRQKLVLITYTYDPEDRTAALELLKKYEEKLYSGKKPLRIRESGQGKISLTSNFRKEAFLEAVEQCKRYIVAGDIFQVVISQRFKTETSLPSFDIYRKLRMINPSPYMFYFDMGNCELVGTSPEVMVKRMKDEDKDEVLLRPIAGTRKRGRNREEDLAIEQDLLHDRKELAEHTMLLDLARNDIGRISEFNTVRVEQAFHIERYSHVMHLVSDVFGKPKEGTTPVGVIGATFPAGTVSGSPKVRAMEIIEELEPEKRGVYAGAIGYIDFRGNTDTCIAIRTIVLKDGVAYLQAGAGIVYDSVPEKEYEETINKAKALMKALV